MLGVIVTSGRLSTPLDAGRWGHPLFSKVFAESGGEESLILQEKTIGTERVPRGHQKSAKGRPKKHQKIGQKKGERNKRERGGRGGGALFMIFEALRAPLGRFGLSILAPTGYRRVDPQGVSRCIWRYVKK